MVDKKIAFTCLLVLLILFITVIVYLYNQWKHLPSLSSPMIETVQRKPKSKSQRFITKKQGCEPPQGRKLPQGCEPPQGRKLPQGCEPPQPLNNHSVCPATAKPPSAPETKVDIQAEPRVVPEPNFNCSPLTTFAPRVEREYVLYVDSACRDFSIFPTPEEYYFKFPVPLYNVTSVDVIQALLPRGQYDINVNNNTFYIEEPPLDPAPVVIPLGDYADEVLLAAAITVALAAAPLANTYVCTANLFKLVFTKTGGFAPSYKILLTKEYDPYGLVRQVLGFPPGEFENDPVTLQIRAPFRTVLNAIEYVDIVAPEITKNYYGSPMLARIPVLGGLNGVTEYDPQTIGTRTFWPIQRLTGLTLQFFAGPTCPINKLLYNFNGLENSLTLRITCQEYKNIFIDDFCIEQMV